MIKSPHTKRFLLILGMSMVAFNLRPSISSVPPLLEVIKNDLGLSYSGVSLLTTIPTLSMGIFALLAFPMSQIFGREKSIFYAVSLISIGTAARIWGSNLSLLLLTTILLGIGIAVAQTLLPSFVKVNFPKNTSLITGVYTTSLTIGAAAAAGLTVPLFTFLGGWNFALATWSIFGIVTLLIWSLIIPKNSPLESPVSFSLPAFPRPSKSNGWVWLLSLFLALVTLLFYSVLSWLSPMYMALGWSANQSGLLLTVFLLTQLIGTMGISILADFSDDRRPWIFISLLLSSIGLFFISMYPLFIPFLWVGVLGVGLGGIFPLSLTLPIDYSPTAKSADHLTSIVLFFGYTIAAIGPLAIGILRDISGNYNSAFIFLFLLNIVALISTFKFKPGMSIKIDT